MRLGGQRVCLGGRGGGSGMQAGMRIGESERTERLDRARRPSEPWPHAAGGGHHDPAELGGTSVPLRVTVQQTSPGKTPSLHQSHRRAALGYKEESWARQLLLEAYSANSYLPTPQNLALAAVMLHAFIARAGLLAMRQEREGILCDFKLP